MKFPYLTVVGVLIGILMGVAFNQDIITVKQDSYDSGYFHGWHERL